MAKWHITKDFERKQCSAKTPKTCRAPGVIHHVESQAEYEHFMESRHGGTLPTNTKDQLKERLGETVATPTTGTKDSLQSRLTQRLGNLPLKIELPTVEHVMKTTGASKKKAQTLIEDEYKALLHYNTRTDSAPVVLTEISETLTRGETISGVELKSLEQASQDDAKFRSYKQFTEEYRYEISQGARDTVVSGLTQTHILKEHEIRMKLVDDAVVPCDALHNERTASNGHCRKCGGV